MQNYMYYWCGESLTTRDKPYDTTRIFYVFSWIIALNRNFKKNKVAGKHKRIFFFFFFFLLKGNRNFLNFYLVLIFFFLPYFFTLIPDLKRKKNWKIRRSLLTQTCSRPQFSLTSRQIKKNTKSSTWRCFTVSESASAYEFTTRK